MKYIGLTIYIKEVSSSKASLYWTTALCRINNYYDLILQIRYREAVKERAKTICIPMEWSDIFENEQASYVSSISNYTNQTKTPQIHQ